MESICELLGTLLLPGKKTQTMKTEMAKAISLHRIPAEFQGEVLLVVFLDTASSCFQVPAITGTICHYNCARTVRLVKLWGIVLET